MIEINNALKINYSDEKNTKLVFSSDDLYRIVLSFIASGNIIHVFEMSWTQFAIISSQLQSLIYQAFFMFTQHW